MEIIIGFWFVLQGDGSSVDVHINLGMAVVESESQHRIDQARRMMAGVTRIIDRLEVTLSIFILNTLKDLSKLYVRSTEDIHIHTYIHILFDFSRLFAF